MSIPSRARCSYHEIAVLISKLFSRRQQHVPCNVYLPSVAQTGLFLSNSSFEENESHFHARARPPRTSEYLDTIVEIEVAGSKQVAVCSGTGASGCRDPSIEVFQKGKSSYASFFPIRVDSADFIVPHIRFTQEQSTLDIGLSGKLKYCSIAILIISSFRDEKVPLDVSYRKYCLWRPEHVCMRKDATPLLDQRQDTLPG